MIIGDAAGPVDRAKQLVNVATNAGRHLQSAQTGLVHYCYRSVDSENQDTIPVVENFLFALALLRERTSETVTEGKRILDRLMYFQNFYDEASQGNFPVYIHEFPHCHDHYLGAQLLPIFYWTLRHFGLLLGADLRERMHTSASALYNYCHHRLEEGSPSFLPSVQIAAASKALGELWENPQVEKEGDERLAELCALSREDSFDAWMNASVLGETLVALQTVYTNLEQSPWKHLWLAACRHWHSKTATFVGPPVFERQRGLQPDPNVLDLLLGFHAGGFSYRSFLHSPYLLKAALIHPSDDSFLTQTTPSEDEGSYSAGRWTVLQTPDYAVTAAEGAIQRDKFGCGLRVVWGDHNYAHSLVCQGGNIDDLTYKAVPGGIDLIVTLPEEVPTEARQKNRELMFFLDKYDGVSISISGHATATAFEFGEPVEIESAGMRINFICALEEGDGQFFGHIAPGNRPSQLENSGDSRFESYDWQLFLRTVERHGKCKIRVALRFTYLETDGESS